MWNCPGSEGDDSNTSVGPRPGSRLFDREDAPVQDFYKPISHSPSMDQTQRRSDVFIFQQNSG
ncbi:hypothetical protein Egran_02141 [Elaphomyces granulatus]|uniref:Uncharacterized protein n=1 Tax=Elaphomyces granulatus TaxID=519963 RepID=A0A232M164_9EURO|nr:hypothetical protein Egran_02141 [Elaphomyces granulatus]